MTATYPILKTKKVERESRRPDAEAKSPTDNVVVDEERASPVDDRQSESRDWDPYTVWKNMIRRNPDAP